jgi:hypothetical protein
MVYGASHRIGQLGETLRRRPLRVVYGASHRAGQLGETSPPRPFRFSVPSYQLNPYWDHELGTGVVNKGLES